MNTMHNQSIGRELLLCIMLTFTASGTEPLNVPADKNPKVTPSIDPKFTPSINPDFTPSINPSLTPSLNPDLTPSLNPDLTPSINPQFTPSINPDFTPSLNPDFTPSLDPAKSKWTGYYLFNVNTEFAGVAVKVKDDEKVMIFFDTKGKWERVFYFKRQQGLQLV